MIPPNEWPTTFQILLLLIVENSKVEPVMRMQQNIHAKLTQGLMPSHLEVINESHQHSVPPGSESHFKVILVSGQFEGKGLLQRHRAVYALLNEEMAQKQIHALALHTFTPAEWEKETAARKSPPCLGGSKSE